MCTTIEQRGVVWFLWAKDMAAKDTHKEMLTMYSEHCLSCQAVHNWVQMFLEARTSFEDKHRVGRPVETATPATLQRVKDIIQADRRVTIDAAATAIGCSHGQAYNMIHEWLGFHKVCSPLGATTADNATQKPEYGFFIAASPALPERTGRHTFPDRHW